MIELFPIIFSFVFMAIVSLIAGVFLKVLNRAWWQIRWVRLVYYLIPIFGGFSIVLWIIGIQFNNGVIIGIGASGAALTVVIQLGMMLSLPLSWATNKIIAILKKVRYELHGPARPNPRRRLLLKSAAAIFPVAAISGGITGVANSMGSINVKRLTFHYHDLPKALDGLKILQISDIHLGYYVILRDLENLLGKVEPEKPDLVLVTGDIADDLTALPYALDMIYSLKPRLGVYASLGNHEYYRGIHEVLEIFHKSPIPLLVDQGSLIEIEDQLVFVGGADDPRWLRRWDNSFLRKTVTKSMTNAPADSFKILMSHRPEAFDHASKLNVNLTLSGHTHGGQIGIAGKSVFEGTLPYKYLWGHYLKANGSQLYTTSGMGHWFPFRLGCPQEAPLITLSRV